MTALRIAFVIPSLVGGGAERAMLAFAGGLDRAAFAPEIVVLDGNGPLRARQRAGHRSRRQPHPLCARIGSSRRGEWAGCATASSKPASLPWRI